mgnify:CR=1 FL=1
MGQDEVMKILERENRWMTQREIEELAGGSRNINHSLNRLHKYGEILKKEFQMDEVFRKKIYKWRMA